MQTTMARISVDLARYVSGLSVATPGTSAARLLDELALAEAKRRYAALPSHVRQTVEARARKANAAKAAKQSA